MARQPILNMFFLRYLCTSDSLSSMLRRQMLTGYRYSQDGCVVGCGGYARHQSPKIAQAAINAANCEDLQPTIEQRNVPSLEVTQQRRYLPCFTCRLCIPGACRRLLIISEGTTAFCVPSMLISGLQNYKDSMLRDQLGGVLCPIE